MPEPLRIMNLEGPDKDWLPQVYHRVHPNQANRLTRAWRVTLGVGVQVHGEEGVRRSKGSPTTLLKIAQNYIRDADGFFDPYLLLAVIANESRGNPACERFEPRIEDWSFGLGQLLTGTAYDILRGAGMRPPDKPIPKGGDKEVWKAFLNQPKNNVPLIRSYLVQLNKRFGLKNDPILIYACYNAGSPRIHSSHPWGLVTNKSETLDHIAAWYGDACEVLVPTPDKVA